MIKNTDILYLYNSKYVLIMVTVTGLTCKLETRSPWQASWRMPVLTDIQVENMIPASHKMSEA